MATQTKIYRDMQSDMRQDSSNSQTWFASYSKSRSFAVKDIADEFLVLETAESCLCMPISFFIQEVVLALLDKVSFADNSVFE